MVKVFMEPTLATVKNSEGGINTIVRAYHQYSTSGGFCYVDKIEDADVHAVHAGSMTIFRPDIPIVSHLHGLYWTGDDKLTESEYLMNASVMNVIRGASLITVPSEWVAKPIRSNVRVNPHILPHGYDPAVWKPYAVKQPFVYWNKNRVGDACSPKWIEQLAALSPRYDFVSTYGTPSKNLNVIGVQSYENNFSFVQQAKIYLSTAKETFGIGTLEALVSKTPVLGFAEGGNLDLVQHKKDGYLARPGDVADLKAGMDWIIDNYDQLLTTVGEGTVSYTWDKIVSRLGELYVSAHSQFVPPKERKVSFVIPMYNKGDLVLSTIASVQTQTNQPYEVIVVDNNSTDGMVEKIQSMTWEVPVKVISEKRVGAAYARNTGISQAVGEYIVCIDADDMIDPKFVEMLRPTLDQNPTIGVAYSGLVPMSEDGNTFGRISEFPPQYNFDEFLRGKNQIPTCAMFRKDLWARVGGQRPKYSPFGAGCEDAEFWFRLGLYGYVGKKASLHSLFWYRSGGTTFQEGYYEADWRSIHRWQRNRETIPFFAINEPDLFSNNVYADESVVSVVIPCTQDHLDLVWDALDSLDYQTLRHKVERIVVFNGVDKSFFSNPELKRLRTAFPHVIFKFFSKKGAGFARNRGAEIATGKFLIFLDADDWLEPNAVEYMLSKYYRTGSIVYGDYYGYSTITDEEAKRLESQNRLLHLDRNNRAKIRFFAADYVQAVAEQQPELMENGQFYIWSLISALVPKAYWQCVGGFDEEMSSWEDWDFWIRLAKEKITFAKIPEPVLNYRFSTGVLRETGKKQYKALLEHMRSKTFMACCGSKRKSNPVSTPTRAMTLVPQQSITTRGLNMATGGNGLVRVKLVDTRSDPQLVQIRGVTYGMRVVGEEFYMQADHAALYPQKYVRIEDKLDVKEGSEITVPEPDPIEPQTEGELIEETVGDVTGEESTTPTVSFDQPLVELGVGLSPVQKKQLRDAGLVTVQDFMNNQEAFEEMSGFSDNKRGELLAAIEDVIGHSL